MAMNDPYAAYQKFASNTRPVLKVVNVGNDEPSSQIAVSEHKDESSAFGKTDTDGLLSRPKMTYSTIGRMNIGLNTQNQHIRIVGPGQIRQAVDSEAHSDVQTEAAEKAAGYTTNARNPDIQRQNQYLENEVMTASPEKLTLMLYDGAIRFMNQAAVYINTKYVEKANNALIRAQDIFLEFMCTLDMDYPISRELYNMYDFIKGSLMQANIKKDAALIREMISLTRNLRDTWAQAMQIANNKKTVK